MDKETLDRVNASIPYAEFPKMRHHPDGSSQIVNSKKEESALGPEWMDREPAVAERQKRDKRDAEMAARLAVTGKPDAARADEPPK